MVSKLLNKDPALRYATADELLKDLRTPPGITPSAKKRPPQKGAGMLTRLGWLFEKPPGAQTALIAAGPDVSAALAHSAYWGQAEAVRYFLAKGADVNGRLKGKYPTALIAAVRGGNVEVVRLLIEAGADVNERGDFYATWSPLAVAQDVYTSNTHQIVDLLKRAGAKP